MNSTVRRGAAVLLIALLTACGSSGPTPPTRTFPPLSGPSRTFVFDRELSYPVQDYTRKSRLVLYDTGAFVLRYDDIGDYRGGYTESNGVITFDWEGWSVAGPWGASATLERTSLTIRFNFIMQMTDFEDAVYALVPS